MDLTTSGVVIKDALKYFSVKNGILECCRETDATAYQGREGRNARRERYQPSSVTCNHCQTNIAEILQESGEFCLHCWQERTHPNL